MRYALGIEYDGTDFFGWQRLTQGRSLQAEVEAALARVADVRVEVICAGRTDSGVHAEQQVVHFDCAAPRTPYAWLMGTNSCLPTAIAVRWAQPVPPDFHARYSARARRYRYRILDRAARPALRARSVAWERRTLDADAMHRAAQAMLGERDFSAFRAAQCQANTPMREMQEIVVSRRADEVVIEVQANAFLHHMVRNIVGSLIPIGRGERPETWIAELLEGRERRVAGITAPPQGLTFLGPRYPAEFGLPAEVTW